MKRNLYFGAVLLLLFTQAQSRQAAWTDYKNQRWGFCIAYPPNWSHDEGVNKAGISVFPPQDGPGGLWSQISVGALLAGRSNGHLLTLEESITGGDDIRRESGETDL